MERLTRAAGYPPGTVLPEVSMPTLLRDCLLPRHRTEGSSERGWQNVSEEEIRKEREREAGGGDERKKRQKNRREN